MRIANMYANLMFLDRPAELRQCFEMLTTRSARLLNFKDYGFAVGNSADIVIFNAATPEQAVAEIAQPIAAFKSGRQTMAWSLPELLRPH
jgi:cytosine deaminase